MSTSSVISTACWRIPAAPPTTMNSTPAATRPRSIPSSCTLRGTPRFQGKVQRALGTAQTVPGRAFEIVADERAVDVGHGCDHVGILDRQPAQLGAAHRVVEEGGVRR